MSRVCCFLIFIANLASLFCDAQSNYLLNKARELAAASKSDSAIFYFTRSLELYPKEVDAYFERGVVFRGTGKYWKSLSDFNISLISGLDSVKVLRERLYSYESLDLLDSVLNDINYLLPRSKKKDEVLYLLQIKTSVLIRLKEFQKAEETIDKSFTIEPDNGWGLFNKAILKVQQLKAQDAMEISNKLIQLYPSNPNSYYVKGISYLCKGLLNPNYDDLETSVRFLKQSHLMAPTVSYFLGDLCRAFNTSFKYDSAINYSNKLIVLNNGDFSGYENLGWAYWGKFEYKKAISELTTALKINPKSVQGYLLRGKSYYGIKNYQLAEIDLKKSIDIEKTDDAYLFLGYIYKAQGKKSQACSYWKIAFNLGATDIEEEMKLYCK